MDNQLMVLGLTEHEGKAVVSSRDVARVFEKEHKNTLADIRKIIAVDDEFNRLNFQPVEYLDGKGEMRPEYLMTRDGFTILVMGYNGDKAMAFKKAYIAAFNEMERSLAPRNYKAALIALIAKEEEREALEAQNQMLKITADKYKGQTNTVGLYKTGEIAKELGISAIRLNDFLRQSRVQYKPSGSDTWQLYTDYARDHFAATQIVKLDNGYEKPMLLWTPKGRDFIYDLCEREMPAWYA